MNTDADQVKIFAGRSNPGLAKQICDYLQIPLGHGETKEFPDGELIVRIDENVRGRDCFIVQSTCNPVNEHLMELCIWIDTLKRASARRISAVIPYFGYARQDRKDEGRVPITAKLVANLLERAGADRIITVDLHASQVQGFFDIPVDHLNAGPVFNDWFRSLPMTKWVFVSPDVGNVKRVQVYANMFGGEICIIDKRRRDGTQADAIHIIGDVEGKTVIMPDDMISTGGTVISACKLLKERGVADIYLSATHAVLSGPAIERLSACPFQKLAVTDTIPLNGRADALEDRLQVLSVAPLFGEAIHRIHHDQSVSALFDVSQRRSR